LGGSKRHSSVREGGSEPKSGNSGKPVDEKKKKAHVFMAPSIVIVQNRDANEKKEHGGERGGVLGTARHLR